MDDSTDDCAHKWEWNTVELFWYCQQCEKIITPEDLMYRFREMYFSIFRFSNEVQKMYQDMASLFDKMK